MTGLTPAVVDNSYNSTGAAASKMLLDYMIDGAIQDGASLTEASKPTQNTIYQFIKGADVGMDLTPDEITRFLNTNDPYDDNTFNPTRYDNWTGGAGGNPYKGYNFNTEAFQADPGGDTGIYAGAAKTAIDTLCHWIAFQVTKDVWWNFGELVAHAFTPAFVPLYALYDHWVMVTGFTANQNPVSSNIWDPWSITEGLQVSSIDFYDPSQGDAMISLSVDEFASMYLPISIVGDEYFGMYVQIDEPPHFSDTNTDLLLNPNNTFADSSNASYPVTSNEDGTQIGVTNAPLPQAASFVATGTDVDGLITVNSMKSEQIAEINESGATMTGTYEGNENNILVPNHIRYR